MPVVSPLLPTPTPPAVAITGSFRVDLGGTVVEFQTPDPRWRGHARERFGAFLTSARPTVRIEHRPNTSGPPVVHESSGTLFFLQGSACWEHLDALLSTLVPEHVAPSLVAHGTLLTDGERSYLCCGCSGAGKTTLASLLPDQALCDELAVVRTTPHGFEGVSLPYWVSRPGSAPLAGVFVLEHAPVHRRRRLGASEGIRELRRHLCWPTEKPEALAQAFATLTRLVQEVPVWRLGFRKDPGVWDLITEPAP